MTTDDPAPEPATGRDTPDTTAPGRADPNDGQAAAGPTPGGSAYDGPASGGPASGGSAYDGPASGGPASGGPASRGPAPDAVRAKSFGAVAAAYDAARPTFPAEALTWILGPGRLQILDLGAGTGKLAAVAAGLGHDVVAVDPSEEMLSVCRRRPGIDTMVGAAESIPLAHASVDAVIVGQAFHWFDHARALPEIARVLRPHGVLGLLWNDADRVVPWVRRLDRAIMGDDFGGDQFDPMPILLQSDLFAGVETARFRHWQDLDRASLRQLALSHSRIAVLTESRREAVLDQIDAIYDTTARPPEPLRMPYFTDCYRTRPSDLANYRRTLDAPVAPYL